MPRPKGLPKSGGRVKGTPNKSTRKFQDSLDALGFDVAEATVKLYQSSSREDIKLNCLKLLAEYSASKPKPAEDTPQPTSESPLDESALLELVKPTE